MNIYPCCIVRKQVLFKYKGNGITVYIPNVSTEQESAHVACKLNQNGLLSFLHVFVDIMLNSSV